jgi:hypothetical protein
LLEDFCALLSQPHTILHAQLEVEPVGLCESQLQLLQQDVDDSEIVVLCQQIANLLA